MRIDWTPRAEADRVAIHDDIADDSSAKQWVWSIGCAAAYATCTFAREVRIVLEAGNDMIREIIGAPYRVI